MKISLIRPSIRGVPYDQLLQKIITVGLNYAGPRRNLKPPPHWNFNILHTVELIFRMSGVLCPMTLLSLCFSR